MNIELKDHAALPALWEINSELEELVFEYEEVEEEEDRKKVEEKIKDLKLTYEKKVVNIGLLIKNWVAYEDMLKEEIDRLQKRKKAFETRREWLKGYLKANMIGNKFESPYVTITFRKSESIEVDPAADLEAEAKKNPSLFRVKTVYEVDKVAVKEQIKQTGVKPDFCELKEKQNIQIK